MRRAKARAGTGVATGVLLVVVGLVGAGTCAQFQLRRGSQRAVARVAALQAAVLAADSALEEASVRLVATPEGRSLLGDGIAAGSLVPAEARRQVEIAGNLPVAISNVTVRPVGAPAVSEEGGAEGLVELEVKVTAGTWRTGVALERTVVRRYQYRTAPSMGSARRALARDEVLPVLLGQWVRA